jgi:1-acyl-sn-glycerol-3-phosphate acyltransferase
MTDPVWADAAEPELASPRGAAWLRVAARGVPSVLLIATCFLLLVLGRLVERPIFGIRRPVTPWITVFVCRSVLRMVGLPMVVHGRPVTGRAAQVANHASWLDILVLNAQAPLYFVSKSEVADWHGIGWLAKMTGTAFIERHRKHARRHTDLFESRLLAGHRLLFFPEGTSTDGRRVLPFKTTLFAAFLSDHLRARLTLQPVSVVYHAPRGEAQTFYGWWGAMSFGAHMLQVLAVRRHGWVEVVYHPPLILADFSDRKVLAAVCEAEVRAGFERLLKRANSPLQ